MAIRGHCEDVVWLLRGNCAGHRDGRRATNACPLRGYSVDVRRIFGGHERLNDVRGEASSIKFTRIV